MYRNRVLHADHRQVLEDGPTTTLAIGSPVLHYTDAAIPGSSPASVVGSDTCGWYCCLDPEIITSRFNRALPRTDRNQHLPEISSLTQVTIRRKVKMLFHNSNGTIQSAAV